MFVDLAGADGVLGYDPVHNYNGGLDDNFSLSAGSPAIGSGTSTGTRRRISPAPRVPGDIDIGAYAFNVLSHTWSGSGGDNLWSDASNWFGPSAPGAGDALVFQGIAQTTTDNDLPAGTSLNSITLASPGFVLGGNGVTLTSISVPVVNLAAQSGTIQLPITLGSNATFAVTDSLGSMMDSGDIDNGGYNLTVDTSSSQASTFGGSISGAGGFITTGAGEVVLTGINSFSGGTRVLAGSLVVTSASALPDGTSLTIGAGGTFIFDPSIVATSATAAASSTGAVSASPLAEVASSSVPTVSNAATAQPATPTSAASVASQAISAPSPVATGLAIQQLTSRDAAASVAKASARSNSSKNATELARDAVLSTGQGILQSPNVAWIWDLMSSQNQDKSSPQLPDAASIDKLLKMDAA